MTTSKDIIGSWQARSLEFDEDDGSGILGQRNTDDTSTRTKITHLQGLGYGIVGTVLSVAYGSWYESPAALCVMQFRFRAKEGVGRYKNAEIWVSFEPRASSDNDASRASHPIIRSFYPENNRSKGPHVGEENHLLSGTIPSSSTVTSSSNIFVRQWPADEYRIKATTWSSKDADEPHEVFWKLFEAEGIGFSGPFRAVVTVKATTAFGLKLRKLPWSYDDPILFDGETKKGRSPPSSDFSNITESDFLGYICDPAISVTSLPANLAETAVKQPETKPQSGDKSKTVFRIRGIPSACSRDDLVELLQAWLGVAKEQFQLRSFTPNPYRDERMAMLSFTAIPAALTLPSPKKEWRIEGSLPLQEDQTANTRKVVLHFDTHFYGFSALGLSSISSSNYTADIIAITGLGGNAYTSFKEPGGPHMWLQDALPIDLQKSVNGLVKPNSERILTYGYNTQLENNQSFQVIDDLARQLRGSLRAIREGDLCKRPIVFIGHSLGGLVVKQLLVQLNQGDEVDKSNLKATRGALFFGVPSLGMDIASFIPRTNPQTNRTLVDSIGTDSQFLPLLAQQFLIAFDFRDSIIFSFYETRLSPTAIKINGKWERTGEPKKLVDIESAINGRPWESDSRFIMPIDRTHSEMAKFEPCSDDYERVLGCLMLLLKDASDIISARFHSLPA
ncbi:hypothetical protein DL95DRAFT_376793 [Leptodontidium sp. 2 PMI_412]|nr:hypothetical protein DL95DRAFT_376793 [Leptodontidium sp. 2 PMI_412]